MSNNSEVIVIYEEEEEYLPECVWDSETEEDWDEIDWSDLTYARRMYAKIYNAIQNNDTITVDDNDTITVDNAAMTYVVSTPFDTQGNENTEELVNLVNNVLITPSKQKYNAFSNYTIDQLKECRHGYQNACNSVSKRNESKTNTDKEKM